MKDAKNKDKDIEEKMNTRESNQITMEDKYEEIRD